MITLILILFILASSMPLNKNAVSSQWFTRLSSITIIFSSFLIMNTFYVDRLYDGLSIFSGFISINSINQTFQILLLLTGGFIVASIINFTSTNNNFNTIKSSLGSFNPSQKYLTNYTFIILFNLVGATCLICAGDLLTLYIAVETQSFSLYILSTLKNDSAKSASAGLKYFLIGSLASTFILLGIALFYYATGLTNFESIFVYYSITDWFSLDGFTGGLMEPNSPYEHSIDLWNFAEMNSYYSIGIFSMILIISGILIKVGAAPFHQWTIDVYSLVPTAVTTWLVILPKIALFVLLFQLLQMLLETGNAMLYSSANNSIIEWMLDGSIQSHISNMTNNNTFNVDYVTDTLNNLYYDQLVENLKLIYGDVTQLYPNYLQIELLNTINSPIISESAYNFVSVPVSENKDFLSSIWSDYTSNMHNSLYYTFNFSPLGAITIKNLLVFISITSMIIGAIGGLYQINIKRLLAFSAISQTGFLIIALAVNNKVSIDAFIFYLGQYSLTTLNLFLVLVAYGNFIYNNSYSLIHLTMIKGNNEATVAANKALGSDINYISQLKGFFEMNPILALSLIISFFSLLGVPPFPGFFAKQQVLLASLSIGWIFVSLIAILTSVVAASYYLNIIKSTILKRTNVLNKTPFLSGSFFNKSSNFQVQQINYNNLSISNVSSYLISSLTLGILLFIFQFQSIANSISNITYCWFQL